MTDLVDGPDLAKTIIATQGYIHPVYFSAFGIML